eukprot:m.114682 g.114682  ORF g.114682 m.114682 type:complete len:836 (-) comp13548_c1_seq4:92-2599(-)
MDEQNPKLVRFDQYGFKRTDGDDQDEENDFRSHNYSHTVEEEEMEKALFLDWKRMLSAWKRSADGAPPEVEELVRRGIPHSLRGQAWQKLLDTEGAKRHCTFDYATELARITALCKRRALAQHQLDRANIEWAEKHKHRSKAKRSIPAELSEDDEQPTIKTVRQISLDLDRTFYTHAMFMERGGQGQQELFNILTAYAAFNPEVGYCQGMAFIAAVLLMSMSEEEAFWALLCLMESEQHLKGFYSERLEKVQEEASVFSGILAMRIPSLALHLSTEFVHPLMYVTQWFMCAFTSLPLWDTVLSIWDAFILRGSTVFHGAGLTVLSICANDLLYADGISQILPILQHLPPQKMTRHIFTSVFWEIDVDELATHVQHVRNGIRAGLDPNDMLPDSWEENRTNLVGYTLKTPAKAMLRQEHGQKACEDAFEPNQQPVGCADEEDVGDKPTLTQVQASIVQHTLAQLATPLRSPAVRVTRGLFSEGSRRTSLGASETLSGSGFVTPTHCVTQVAGSSSQTPCFGRGSPFHKTLNSLTDIQFSPSFHRAGLLSPSFRGNATDIMLDTSMVSMLDISRLVLSPTRDGAQCASSEQQQQVLDFASPGTRAAFSSFMAATPLRTSQAENAPLSSSRRWFKKKNPQQHSLAMFPLVESPKGQEVCMTTFNTTSTASPKEVTTSGQEKQGRSGQEPYSPLYSHLNPAETPDFPSASPISIVSQAQPDYFDQELPPRMSMSSDRTTNGHHGARTFVYSNSPACSRPHARATAKAGEGVSTTSAGSDYGRSMCRGKVLSASTPNARPSVSSARSKLAKGSTGFGSFRHTESLSPSVSATQSPLRKGL